MVELVSVYGADVRVLDKKNTRDEKENKKNVLPFSTKKRKFSALIVEDDMASIYLIDVALQKTGQFMRMDWATSAEEAINYIKKRIKNGQENPYDLIIIDIFLDGKKTGLDLWQYLYEENLQNIPVIMTSSISEKRFSDLMGRYSIMPHFLKKPFHLQVAEEMVGEILSKTL